MMKLLASLTIQSYTLLLIATLFCVPSLGRGAGFSDEKAKIVRYEDNYLKVYRALSHSWYKENCKETFSDVKVPLECKDNNCRGYSHMHNVWDYECHDDVLDAAVTVRTIMHYSTETGFHGKEKGWGFTPTVITCGFSSLEEVDKHLSKTNRTFKDFVPSKILRPSIIYPGAVYYEPVLTGGLYTGMIEYTSGFYKGEYLVFVFSEAGYPAYYKSQISYNPFFEPCLHTLDEALEICDPLADIFNKIKNGYQDEFGEGKSRDFILNFWQEKCPLLAKYKGLEKAKGYKEVKEQCDKIDGYFAEAEKSVTRLRTPKRGH